MSDYVRCRSCTQYSLSINCCLLDGMETPIIMDNIKCYYYERNENMRTFERCKTCKHYRITTDDCFINSCRTPLIDDNEGCNFYEGNENMTQNKTKKIKKKYSCVKEVLGDVPKADDIANYSVMDDKEKSQAELLAEAMHQQTMDVVNGYIGHADMVNHPPHYADSCSLECIESMEIAFGIKYTAVYCLINAYKYLWRRKAKNGSQDVEKALWYLDRYNSYVDMLSFIMPSDEYDMYNEKERTMYGMATKAKGEGDCENEK